MISNLSNPFSLERIHSSYLKCRKGKKNSYNTIRFQTNLFSELQHLSKSLNNKTYKPSRSICFYFQKPKLREVIAANFRDRVVHRLLVDILEPEYEKSFIKDSYACRKEKGTHAAVKRLKEFISSGTRKAKAPLYYLQLDIKGYFFEIDKDILLQILSKKVKEDNMLYLAKTIIDHDPTEKFVYKGRIPPKEILPPHKTLFHPNKRKGLPIGNLTSQFFANLYLNELDQYVKRSLGVKFYLRYMDDFILLSESKEELLEFREKIKSFLADKLQLTLKEPNNEPISIYNGIDFLGYFIKPRYTLVRKRVVVNMKKALFESLPPKPREKNGIIHIDFFPDFANWKRLQARINSYLGHLKNANSKRLIKMIKKCIRPFYPFLQIKHSSLQIYPKRPDRFRTFSSQIDAFCRLTPRAVLIVETGRFYNLFNLSQFDSNLLLKQKWIILIPRYRTITRTLIGCKYKHLNKLIHFLQDNFSIGVFLRQMQWIKEKILLRSVGYHWIYS